MLTQSTEKYQQILLDRQTPLRTGTRLGHVLPRGAGGRRDGPGLVRQLGRAGRLRAEPGVRADSKVAGQAARATQLDRHRIGADPRHHGPAPQEHARIPADRSSRSADQHEQALHLEAAAGHRAGLDSGRASRWHRGAEAATRGRDGFLGHRCLGDRWRHAWHQPPACTNRSRNRRRTTNRRIRHRPTEPSGSMHRRGRPPANPQRKFTPDTPALAPGCFCARWGKAERGRGRKSWAARWSNGLKQVVAFSVGCRDFIE